MKSLEIAPSLTEQVYGAILDEICDGTLAAGEHLVQEQLAEQLGVSRQPIQQAMALLKADGLVEEIGRRGLQVAGLDLALMRHHYDIRAALDGYAARSAAGRAHRDPAFAEACQRQGHEILSAGRAAIAASSVRDQIRHDEALHKLIYDWSGNPLVTRTAEPHWRFLRRAMGDVLRHAEPPRAIWNEHAAIVDAIVAGEPDLAETRAVDHATGAADLLARAFEARGSDQVKTQAQETAV